MLILRFPGGVDYTFTWSQRAEYLATGIFPFARWIHLHRKPDNLTETILSQMVSLPHETTDPIKSHYIRLFGRLQRILTEMRHHMLDKREILRTSYFKVLSERSGRIDPHPHISSNCVSNSARSAF